MARVTPSDRRARILAAARDTFAQRGFAGARMDDIAVAVGISRSALYSMFDTKEALFRALVTGLIAEVLPVLVPDDFGGAPADKLLRGFIRAAFIRLTSNDLAFLPRLIIGEGLAFPDLVRFYHDEGIVRVLGVIERLIAYGVERGEFTCPEPALAARSVAGGIILSALWRIVFEPVGGAPIDVPRMAEIHAEMMLQGLIARDGAGLGSRR
jgi:AcrR family transcriptional regulator